MNLERAALLVAAAFVLGHVYWMMRHRFEDRADPRARLDAKPRASPVPDTITEARVDAEFRRLCNILAPEYHISLEFKPLEGLRGQVLIVSGTLGGEVRIDLAKHSSFSDVRHTLIHEIVHLLLEPFCAYRHAVTGGVSSAAEDVAWYMATEGGTEAATEAIIRALAQHAEERP
jgi:hypothetical protein